MWGFTEYERLRLRCSIDAVNVLAFGLNFEELNRITAQIDYHLEKLNNLSKEGLLAPKGFWRVDKDKDPELRHTVLTLVAFQDLEEKIRECGGNRDKGIEAFLNQNDGEGWMLPETLRLADYGLGHDERAKEHQPVATASAPGFTTWQLAQSPGGSSCGMPPACPQPVREERLFKPVRGSSSGYAARGLGGSPVFCL